MKPVRQTTFCIVGVLLGWGLMAAAYDKPDWYFQGLGILGVLLVIASIVWLVKGVFSRAQGRNQQ